MTKDTNPQTENKPSKPHKRLNILIGTWDMKGHTLDSAEDNITGWNTFEWLPGGFFLKSNGEINFKGEIIQSLKIIGYDPATNMFPHGRKCPSIFLERAGEYYHSHRSDLAIYRHVERRWQNHDRRLEGQRRGGAK